MNYYLVDYENVSHYGLDGIENIKDDDTVCIFYSANANSIPIDLFLCIKDKKSNIFFQKVDVSGKNSLDFQLISYLGYTMSENKDKDISYYIVTKDKEYNSLLSYWNSRGFNICQVTNLKGDEHTEKHLNNNFPVNDISIYNTLFSILGDKELANTVAKCINENPVGDVHNAMMTELSRKIGNNGVTEIYNKVKYLLREDVQSLNQTENIKKTVSSNIQNNDIDSFSHAVVQSSEDLEKIFDDNIKEERLIPLKHQVINIIKWGTNRNDIHNELRSMLSKYDSECATEFVKLILSKYKEVLSQLPGSKRNL